MTHTVVFEKAGFDSYRDIIEHANFVFSHAHGACEFKTMLPKTYGETPAMWPEHFVARENGRIRALVGLLPLNLRAGNEHLKLGFIGTVSVNPYERGRGFMKKCMAMAEEHARAEKMDLLALGGQRQRYGYFGFVKGGWHASYNVNRSNCRHALSNEDASGFDFVPFEKATESLPAVCALHESAPCTVARPEAHFSAIACSYYLSPLVILRNGSFAGYALTSQNRDHIHELRLADESLAGNVVKAYFAAFGVSEVQIRLAPHQRSLMPFFNRISENMTVQPDNMYRILDFERVAGAFLRLKLSIEGTLPEGVFNLGIRTEDSVRNLSLRVEGNTASARFTEDESDIILSESEAGDLLLSPMPHADLSRVPFFARAWLPLPVSIETADGF